MAVNFTKLGTYESVLKEKEMKEPVIDKPTKPFFSKNHYIFRSDNPDDAVIKNAVAPFLKPVPYHVKQRLSLENKEIVDAVIIPPGLSGLNNTLSSEPGKENFASFQDYIILENLPENWKNYDPTLTDEKRDKKLLTTRVPYQQNCGSCYAFSVANAISDVLLFAGLDYNPNISPMCILSCVNISDNSQCNGGSPMATLEFIAQNGILTSHCMNYQELLNKNVYTPPVVGKTQNTDTTMSID